MRKANRLKKGFTLVELAIVIAVIAILIAVLVPTFIALIDKANESSDKQLAKNMNTSLSTYAATNGEPETPHEALEALEADGFLLKNMTPTSNGYNYVWDGTTNSIALLDNEFNIVYSENNSNVLSSSNLWAIVSTQEQVSAFDASSKATFKYCIVSDEKITVNNDFDSYLIEEANVTLSNTADTQATKYTIYTNGGEITLDVPYGEVYHVGTATLVNANNVYFSSYHLDGLLTMFVLKNGHIVIDENTNISYLAIDNSEGNDPKVTINSVDAVGTIMVTTKNDSGYDSIISGTYSASIVVNSSIASGVSGITYITGNSNSEVAEKFDNFIAEGCGIGILQTNVTTSNPISLDTNKFVLIDLNGYTLTSTSSYSNSVKNSSELTISDGTLSFNDMATRSTGAFVVESSSKLTLSNVEATTNGCMLFPKGDASEVNVLNSYLYSTGAFCLSTNASEVYTCNIIVENSILQVEDGFCTVYINVDVTLDINNSAIIGGNAEGKGWIMDISRYGVAAQALLIRSGTVNMVNSTVTLYTDDEANKTVEWYSNGNAAPFTAIVIGDGADAANYHKANAVLTMTDCTVNVLAAKGCTLTTARAVYMYGKDAEGYESNLVINGSTAINGQIIAGGSLDDTTGYSSYKAKYECEQVKVIINDESTTISFEKADDGTVNSHYGVAYTYDGTTLTKVED